MEAVRLPGTSAREVLLRCLDRREIRSVEEAEGEGLLLEGRERDMMRGHPSTTAAGLTTEFRSNGNTRIWKRDEPRRALCCG